MAGKKVVVSIQTERGEQTVIVDSDSLKDAADGINHRVIILAVKTDGAVESDDEKRLGTDLRNLQGAFEKASEVKP